MTKSTAQIVKEHLKASKEVRKEIGNSKAKALKFLVTAGFVTKSGKPTKPYR